MKIKAILGMMALLGIILIVEHKSVQKYSDIIMFYLDRPNPPRDSQGRLCWVGLLGGKPVKIPRDVVYASVQYEGGAHIVPNALRDEHVGGREQYFSLIGNGRDETYRSNEFFTIAATMPIEDLWLSYRIPDNRLFTHDVMLKNDEEEISKEHWFQHDWKSQNSTKKIYPFSDIHIYGGQNYIHPPYDFLDQRLEKLLSKTVVNALNHDRELNVNYQEEPSPIAGLTYYQANKGIDPDTGKPWTWDGYSPDIFVQRGTDNSVRTIIQCRFTGEIKRCLHLFYPQDMNVIVGLNYDRYFLPQWQTIETRIARIMQSWVVSPSDKDTQQFTTLPTIRQTGSIALSTNQRYGS